ncbi:calcium/proton exchanger, partial [Rhizodiscina lignyota]
IRTQLKAVLYPQWLTINWLLVLVPIGIAVAQVDSIPAIAVFVINFLAIVPLAGILSYATEEIAMRVGETLGGLLNASFGNAVELIVGIIALVKNEVIIVQTSLIGSMLSNLLLVMGMCFFFGGMNRLEQNFNVIVAQTAASLLALAFGCLIIPTAFTWGVGGSSKTNSDEKISRGTAIIMLIVYISYLIFQLKTHKEIYNTPSEKVEKRKGTNKDEGESIQALMRAGAGQAAIIGGSINRENLVHPVEEDEEDPQLSLVGAMVTLAGSTALVGVCAEFLVDSINKVTCQYHVSQYFVGLILLPIVGNAAEHATAVTVGNPKSCKDKMDLAIGVAVGSSMQIALFVLPLMIVLAWIIGGRDLTLVFDDFQIAVLFVAVLLVNYLISDGKSHWMEGVLLMSLYIIIATCSWFYP